MNFMYANVKKLKRQITSMEYRMTITDVRNVWNNLTEGIRIKVLTWITLELSHLQDERQKKLYKYSALVDEVFLVLPADTALINIHQNWTIKEVGHKWW